MGEGEYGKKVKADIWKILFALYVADQEDVGNVLEFGDQIT